MTSLKRLALFGGVLLAAMQGAVSMASAAGGVARGAPEGGDSSSSVQSPAVLYMLHCSGCHGMDGMGSREGGVPPFPDVVGSFTEDPRGRIYMTNVPGVVSSNLDPPRIAAVLNYVVEKWAGTSKLPGAKRFDAAEVKHLWENRPSDVVSLRRELVRDLIAQGKPVPDNYPWP